MSGIAEQLARCQIQVLPDAGRGTRTLQLRPWPHMLAQRVSLALACLVAIGAGCARHKEGAPTSIPAPLVSALIDDRGSPARPAPNYAIGTLPPGYPVALVPAGPVTIVGGMATGDQIVAVFSDSTRRLAAVLEQLFEKAGFVRPAPTPASGFSGGSGPYSYFCADSGTVSATPLTGANRTFVRVTYQRMYRGFSCRVHERTVTPTQLVLPELRPPAGVHVTRSHGGSSSDGIDASAEVTGNMLVPSVILAHYANQLVAAGWTAATPAVSDRVAAQFFEAKDASGGQWEGVLMASGSRTALTVSLTMRPRTSP